MEKISRELKFRAYYQKVTDDKFIIEGEYTMKDLTDKGILFDQERIHWVEFTGFKDSRGEEIYEGDIVAVENEGAEITVCKFNVGGWILEDNAGGHWTRQLYHQSERLEIWGNIYENPELVEL